MTNEEITIRHTCANDKEYSDIMVASRERAEWKDQQAEPLTQTAYESGYDKTRQEIREYLEKVRQDYAHELCVNRDWKQGAMEARIKHEVIVKIINELFGGE